MLKKILLLLLVLIPIITIAATLQQINKYNLYSSGKTGNQGNVMGIAYKDSNIIFVSKTPAYLFNTWLYKIDISKGNFVPVSQFECGDFDDPCNIILDCWSFSHKFLPNSFILSLDYYDYQLVALTATKLCCQTSDLNGDNIIDIKDIGIFKTQWLTNTGIDYPQPNYVQWLKGDLNYDYRVDFRDYAILSSHYGKIVNPINGYWPEEKWTYNIVFMDDEGNIINVLDINLLPYVLTGICVDVDGIWIVGFNGKILIHLNQDGQLIKTISLITSFPINSYEGPTDIAKSFNNGFFLRDHVKGRVIEINKSGQKINEFSTKTMWNTYGRGFSITTDILNKYIYLTDDDFILTIKQ